MIEYYDSAEGLTEGSLADDFFQGWPNPPSKANFLRILQNSTYIVLAVDNEKEVGQVIGFINAISDRVLTAYIPLLEVIPEYQGRHIGYELTKRMQSKLDSYYMVDLLCDPELQGFYRKFGMFSTGGMIKRNYKNQSGIDSE